MSKELILDFADLRWIDIQCGNCGMHTVLDVGDQRTNVPAKCPGCNTAFESVGLQNALLHFMNAYRNLTALKQAIRVRVPLNEPGMPG